MYSCEARRPTVRPRCVPRYTTCRPVDATSAIFISIMAGDQIEQPFGPQNKQQLLKEVNAYGMAHSNSMDAIVGPIRHRGQGAKRGTIQLRTTRAVCTSAGQIAAKVAAHLEAGQAPATCSLNHEMDCK